MAYRTVFAYVFAFLAWVFLCFIELLINGFNVLLGTFGGVIGLICGVATVRWQLKIVEKNGEFKATRKMQVLALSAIIILVLLLAYFTLAYFALYLALARQITSFVFLILPLFYATQIVLLLNWEKKQKKHVLFEGFMSTRVYAD